MKLVLDGNDSFCIVVAAIQMIDDDDDDLAPYIYATRTKQKKKVCKKYDCVVVFDVDGKA